MEKKYKFVKAVENGNVQVADYVIFYGDLYLGRYTGRVFTPHRQDVSLSLMRNIVEFEKGSEKISHLEIFDKHTNQWLFHSKIETQEQWSNASLVIKYQGDCWRIVEWESL